MPSVSTILSASVLAMLATASPLQSQENLEKRECSATPAVIYVAGTKYNTPITSSYPTVTDDTLAGLASAAIPGSVATALPYPCTGGVGGSQYYQTSWYDGVVQLQSMITNYLDGCSGGKIALLGYSQGGAVVSAALGGYYAAGGPNVPALDEQYADAIVGGVVFADTSFVYAESPLSYNGVGYEGDRVPNNYSDGTIPNGNDNTAQDLFNSRYGNRFRSYCEADDEFCSTGSDQYGGTIHGQEEGYWYQTALQFLKSLNL